MERSFKVKTFERWMRKAGLTDAMLRVAVEEMSRGLIDASLGGHLVKKRVARTGYGKRGGYRTIVAKKAGQHWFFLFGFQKIPKHSQKFDLGIPPLCRIILRPKSTDLHGGWNE